MSAAPTVQAGQVGWAHQAAGFQSNGAVTVKSLAGGSYAGTQNPTGAVSKANQSASTQGPTVIIQATGASGTSLRVTRAQFNGNLGGLVGADSKCAAEFGSEWKMADLFTVAGTGASHITFNSGTRAWIHSSYINSNPSNYSCNNWTSALPSGGGATLFGAPSSGGDQGWAETYFQCSQSAPILCVR